MKTPQKTIDKAGRERKAAKCFCPLKLYCAHQKLVEKAKRIGKGYREQQTPDRIRSRRRTAGRELPGGMKANKETLANNTTDALQQ